MKIYLMRSWLPALLLGMMPLLAFAGGDEVVVVYNSRLPESKQVAEHYAAMRQVPAGQIFGFDLTTNDVINRDDFISKLQKPLAAKLVSAGLWHFEKVNIPATTNRPAHREERLVNSSIRYAALCYGIPLKIAPSSDVDDGDLADQIKIKEFRRNEAAVDSELAWLPLVRNKIPLTGPLPNPFYTVTNAAAFNCTNGILLVTRLDGPSFEVANHLVDKAMDAESNGLWGRVYIDARGLNKSNSYYEGDFWMMSSASICRQIGYDVDLDTNEATFPATYPMSSIAIYAGWYTSAADGPFKASKMEFMPGAFAYHLYSFSAASLHGDTTDWCGALLDRGATCTMGCVYEPYLQLTPNIAFFLLAWGNGYTFGEATWASQRALSWQTTVIGDPLYRPYNKQPAELFLTLSHRNDPRAEWAFDRVISLDLLHGVGLEKAENILETIPLTRQSAVLTEHLSEIEDQLGKPASAIDALQTALKLNPTPQQRIRLHHVLGQKLIAAGRLPDAAENWRAFIADSPDYPGIDGIRQALADLERQLGDSHTNK